jgi:polysaccharide pyruvyl transferase WcaK-like protein
MCDYIVGMRFHSVVTAVTLNIPTVILASHEQIEALGKELNLTDWFIRIDHENIAQELIRLFDKLKDNKSKVIESYKSSLSMIKESHKKYIERIKELIRK